MAVITMTHYSDCMDKEMNLNIFVPDKIAEGTKVLYLLHGLSDSYESWFRNTNILYSLRDKNLIVVCPDGGRSFYSNYKGSGDKYFDYVSKELPKYIEKLFRVSVTEENRYVAGLSMGGYGAYKLALNFPDRYKGAASFSGAMDVMERMKNNTFENYLFEEEHKGEISDLFALALKAEKASKKPKLYQWCGTSDFLYEDNLKFKEFMEKLEFDYTYKESEGSHSWDYWETQFKVILDFFKL